MAKRKTQIIDRQSVGLMLNPNPYALPEGALLEADNIAIDRPNIASKVRGLNRYGDELSNPPSAIGEFQDKIIVLDGTTLKYDSDDAGTWSSLSGTYAKPDANNRMRFLESSLLGSVYFTTSTGVFRLDDLTTGTPVRTGIPQGLDLETSFTGTGLGFLGAAQVGYKVVFLRKDTNDQEIIGAPSFRLVITNSKTAVTWAFAAGTVTVTQTAHGYTTGDTVQVTLASDAGVETPTSTITKTGDDTYTYTVAGTPAASGTASVHRDEDISLTTTIPDEIVAGDFYELYRTEVSADTTAPPGARYLKVNRVELAAGDITAGTVTFTDDFPEAFLGEDLYNNPNAQGGGQANHRPPFSLDIANYRGHTFYSNTRQPHRLELQFLEASDLSGGETITIGARTYTSNTSAENIGTQTFLLEQGLTTEAENVAATMRSLVRVANRDTGNSVFYLHYISGTNDPPGEILIERRDLTDTALAVTVDAAGTGDNFSPVLPTSGTTISTVADSTANRLYRSKFEQPDAVPLSNFDPIGASRDEILRIVELRDSLMIFTERGIYRLSGEDELSFDISKLETDIQLLAPESTAVLNDSVRCFTNQGVATINENGAKIESFYGIEKELLKINTFSNFKTLTWGIAYEDRKYLLFTQDESGDTTATVAWVWNDFTKTWTRRLKKAVVGIVPTAQDKLYLGHAVDSYVLQERKTFGVSQGDFIDEDISVTIDTVSTTTNSDGDTVSLITLTYTYTEEDLEAEWLLTQSSSTFSRILAVTDNGSNSYTCTCETEEDFSTGAATVSIPIASRIRWKPETADNPGAKKQFTYVTFSVEEDVEREANIGFLSDSVPLETFVDPIEIQPSIGWGSVLWSPSPWGSSGISKSTPLRIPVPQSYQRCQGLSVIWTHNRARSSFGITNLAYTARMLSDRTNQDP
jgi:hypothetical protein